MTDLETSILLAIYEDVVSFRQREWWPEGQRHGSRGMQHWRRQICGARQNGALLDFTRWRIESCESPAGRKRRSRALANLEAQGLLVRKNEGGRSVAAWPTEAGMKRAVRLTQKVIA
jgi:hypothetical protein